jgi:hypothetical protein
MVRRVVSLLYTHHLTVALCINGLGQLPRKAWGAADVLQRTDDVVNRVHVIVVQHHTPLVRPAFGLVCAVTFFGTCPSGGQILELT